MQNNRDAAGPRNNGNNSFMKIYEKGASVEINRSPLMVRGILNGCRRELELDTGSSVSIMTDGMVRNIRSSKVGRRHQKARD